MSRVRLKPQVASPDPVRSGVAVSTPTWKPLSRQANWIIGHGAALAPMWSPTTTLAPGATATYTIRTIPRLQALRRLYVVRVSGVASGVTNLTITVNGVGTEHAAFTPLRTVAAFEYIEDVAAPSTAEETIVIKIAHGGANGAIVYGIGVWELPRADLIETSASLEYGCDPELVRAKQPIQDSDAGNVGGVARAIDAAAGIATRAGLFSWAVDEADAISFANPPYSPVFGLNVPILGRRKNHTTVMASTQWRLWARATTAATTGAVRITSSSTGSNAVIAVGGGPVVFGLWPPPPAVANVVVDAEDVTTVDGRVGAAWDELTIEAGVTAGPGAIEIAGIFGAETP